MRFAGFEIIVTAFQIEVMSADDMKRLKIYVRKCKPYEPMLWRCRMVKSSGPRGSGVSGVIQGTSDLFRGEETKAIVECQFCDERVKN